MDGKTSTEEFVQDKNEVMIFEVHLQSIFKEISEGVSLEKFKQLFGDVVNNQSSLLEKLHAVFQQELYNRIMEDVQLKELIAEENLEEKFKKRSKLIKEHSLPEGVRAWRPTTGDVDQQQRSRDMEVLLRHKRQLEETVLTREAYVDQLKVKLTSLRLKIRKMDAEIAASRRSNAEAVAIARRVHDSLLSASLENSQNTRKQS